jgi:hypothetical protein
LRSNWFARRVHRVSARRFFGRRVKRLAAAVLDAYGWAHDLSDEEILARLLKLNVERAKGS